MVIDKTSEVPRYAQLKNIIREQIQKGDLKPGERIVAERELALQHNVSRITATRAVNDLVQEGLLLREQGRGTFVRDAERPLTMNIGFVIQDEGSELSSFYLEIFRGMQDVVQAEGYNLIFTSVRTAGSDEHVPIKMVHEGRVDGFVLVELWDEPVLKAIMETGMPVALVDWEHPEADSIVADDRQALAEAVGHLTEQGHKRIAFINGRAGDPANLPTLEEAEGMYHTSMTYIGRFAGYRDGLAAAGIEYDASLVSWGGTWKENGGDEVRALFDKKPTGLVAASDSLALDAIDIFRRQGGKVPEDLSVVGLGGTVNTREQARFLTTVKIDWAAMGRQSMHQLLGRIHGSGQAPVKIKVPGRLIRKQSCRILD